MKGRLGAAKVTQFQKVWAEDVDFSIYSFKERLALDGLASGLTSIEIIRETGLDQGSINSLKLNHADVIRRLRDMPRSESTFVAALARRRELRQRS
jgi:hypothetical protein